MSQTETSDYKRDPPVSFRWDAEERDRFSRVVSRLKAEGELPRDVSESDIFRALAEEWAEQPDAAIVKR
jgi:hypothetical protein